MKLTFTMNVDNEVVDIADNPILQCIVTFPDRKIDRVVNLHILEFRVSTDDGLESRQSIAISRSDDLLEHLLLYAKLLIIRNVSNHVYFE